MFHKLSVCVVCLMSIAAQEILTRCLSSMISHSCDLPAKPLWYKTPEEPPLRRVKHCRLLNGNLKHMLLSQTSLLIERAATRNGQPPN